MSCDEDDLPPPRLKIAGYLPRLTDQEQAILEATRGLSPECVAACVAAVRAEAAYRRLLVQLLVKPDSDWRECDQLKHVASNAFFAAVALLPKEGT